MNNVKTDEPAIKITTPDGIELTPVKPLLTSEQEKQFMDSINSPESQKYFANKMQEQINESLGLGKSIQQPKNLMVEKQTETIEPLMAKATRFLGTPFY